MRFMILLSVLLPSFAFAELGDIDCIAKQFTVTEKGIQDEIEKPLVVETQIGSAIRLVADIGDHAYVLSGDTVTGDFMLTQAWGPEYRRGINATGSFTSTGRLQISLVEEEKVFKLVCVQVRASQFPAE